MSLSNLTEGSCVEARFPKTTWYREATVMQDASRANCDKVLVKFRGVPKLYAIPWNHMKLQSNGRVDAIVKASTIRPRKPAVAVVDLTDEPDSPPPPPDPPATTPPRSAQAPAPKPAGQQPAHRRENGEGAQRAPAERRPRYNSHAEDPPPPQAPPSPPTAHALPPRPPSRPSRPLEPPEARPSYGAPHNAPQSRHAYTSRPEDEVPRGTATASRREAPRTPPRTSTVPHRQAEPLASANRLPDLSRLTPSDRGNLLPRSREPILTPADVSIPRRRSSVPPKSNDASRQTPAQPTHTSTEGPLPPPRRHHSSGPLNGRIPRRETAVSSDPEQQDHMEPPDVQIHNRRNSTFAPNTRRDAEPPRPPHQAGMSRKGHSGTRGARGGAEKRQAPDRSSRALVNGLMHAARDSEREAERAPSPTEDIARGDQVHRNLPRDRPADFPPRPRRPHLNGSRERALSPPLRANGRSHPGGTGWAGRRSFDDMYEGSARGPSLQSPIRPPKRSRSRRVEEMDPFASLTEKHSRTARREPNRIAHGYESIAPFVVPNPDVETRPASSTSPIQKSAGLALGSDAMDLTVELDKEKVGTSTPRKARRKGKKPARLRVKEKAPEVLTDQPDLGLHRAGRFRIIPDTSTRQQNEKETDSATQATKNGLVPSPADNDSTPVTLRHHCACGFNAESAADQDRRSSGSIQCGLCSMWSHLRCTLLSDAEVKQVLNGKRFLCLQCVEHLQQSDVASRERIKFSDWVYQVKPSVLLNPLDAYEILGQHATGPRGKAAMVRKELSQTERDKGARNVELLRQGLALASISGRERTVIDSLSDKSLREMSFKGGNA